MNSSPDSKRKSKKRKVLTDQLFNRLHLVNVFDDDFPSNSSLSIVNSYSPCVRGSCTLAWHLPADPLNIQYYRRCLAIPGEIPYFIPSPRTPYLPPEQSDSFVRQPRFTSLLPLLLTAQGTGIDVRQYNIISERNSLRKIAMNNEVYTIGVIKFGSSIFLRRYDTYQTINRNDIGYRFEQMCTTGNYLDGNYIQLIEGHIGTLKTLMTGETDAVERRTGQSIELKCHRKPDNQDIQDWWLQAFLSGVTKVIHGCRALDDPERLINMVEYPVSEMSHEQYKNRTLEFLYQVLQFLSSNVIEGRNYLLSRRIDPTTRKHRLYLYEVTNKIDKEKLTFLTEELLNRLLVTTR
ncbi:unnamed protein product [Adineta steineri]|uniref:Decapping nuclease n=1 Tax=Adineta steineri TaxID=433720 RepID=A0A818RQN1_9BILA|nr:unnamed protein product [Adineta steineri]